MLTAKPVVWSHSSITLYKQCPHKYYRTRIKKDIVEPASTQMLYGRELHTAAEHFVRDGTPLPNKFSFMTAALMHLQQMPGEKLCEYKMGLRKDLTPCEFFDPQVWWRGVADLLVLDADEATLVDYKTGKSAKYADTSQLDILSLAVFKHFPKIKKVRGGLLYVVNPALVKDTFLADDQDIQWRPWLLDVERLEQAHETGVFNPRPNFSCNGWCPVSDCVHNWRPYALQK